MQGLMNLFVIMTVLGAVLSGVVDAIRNHRSMPRHTGTLESIRAEKNEAIAADLEKIARACLSLFRAIQWVAKYTTMKVKEFFVRKMFAVKS